MIYREHLVELYVNGEKLELENQKSLNLRMNNVIYDPTKISSKQADYSFSFDIPSTSKNDRIFDYANNLAKNNKFHIRWDAEVYADGQKIFDGSLTINSFKEKKYNVNLVSVKTYSLEDIFGDAVLTDIPWYKPYDGAVSINAYNENKDKEVSFPLVSYGAFQKTPQDSDEIGNTYTSKFDIDKYNKWWIESFYPSLNMMETLRKAFQWKGYNVDGDAFNDPNLYEIFMSCNLSSEQMPTYNFGNPRLGAVNLTTTYTTSGSGYEQELEFPYFLCYNPRGSFGGSGGQSGTVEAWNWQSIRVYDILKNGSTTIDDTYMYDPNEKAIVIPSDGFYKIDLDVTCTLNTSGNLTASQYCVTNNGSGNNIEEKQLSMPVGFYETTPLEIHLIRNYSDNCELIKGKNNKQYTNGNPTQSTNYNGQSNVKNWLTCFPHEDLYRSQMPTNKNDLTVKTTSRWNTASSNFGGARTGNTSSTSTDSSTSSSAGGTTSGGHFGGRRGGRAAAPTTSRDYNYTNYGYVYRDGQVMAYDQAVSDNFICGFSTFLGGTSAVMKNGYSWSKSTSIQNYAFYKNIGYNHVYLQSGNNYISQSATTFNKNEYINAPYTNFSCSENRMVGSLSCMVYLNKSDILELFAIQRAYNTTAGTDVNYSTTNTVKLKITAASPNSYGLLKASNYGYYDASQFDYDLKLSNFLNNETNVSTFIQGIADAYNLELIQNGKNITINSKKYDTNYNGYAVNIDDRVNSADAESSIINYPRSMAIKYKIDTDEWGFERSVTPQSMLNQPNWMDYGDYGYSTIELNDDSYITTTSDKNINFSYTWYDNFNWYNVDADDEQSGNPVTLRIPCISNFEYMIDGYDYDEAMKHDGYSLTQRFWYRPQATNTFVWLDSKPSERINIYVPTNTNGTLNLSYKTSENSLLRYFNTRAYLASNYVTVDVYLSPKEYNELKGGALVNFDKDLYYVVEISSYDPTGINSTSLKLMKKVI